MNTHYEEDEQGNKRLVIKPDTEFEKEFLLYFSASATIFMPPNEYKLCVQEKDYKQ